MYAHFHYELGDDSYFPPGSDKVSDYRLFGRYHANTPEHNKEVIMKSLSKLDGVVRVVFATVALGMGVNMRVGGVVSQTNQQDLLYTGDLQTVCCGRTC